MPSGGQRDSSNHKTLTAITWPKRAHPGALTKAGQERTPWLTSWARATFEQGCLSVLPHLEGPCKAYSLPGEHLFQASRIAPDRMRPVIFHAFGKAKLDAPDQLGRLARLGWETLPPQPHRQKCHSIPPSLRNCRGGGQMDGTRQT